MMPSCRADTNVANSKPPLFGSSGFLSVRSLAVLFAMLLTAANADAIVIDFSAGTLGTLTPSENIGGVQVDGFYYNGSWLQANLFRRNENPNDHGLGICNPGESCSYPGGGDINELDNNGYRELIRLTLQTGFLWTGVAISSIDDNDDDDDEVERGQAFATNDGNPANLVPDAWFWRFDGDGAAELTHAVTGTHQQAQYIFFQPYDWSGGHNSNNDFLVWQATIEPIPEPGTLGLLGVGLLGLVLASRRKKSWGSANAARGAC